MDEEITDHHWWVVSDVVRTLEFISFHLTLFHIVLFTNNVRLKKGNKIK